MPRPLRTLHRQNPESQCSPRGGSTRKPTSSTTATTLLRDRVFDPIASAIGHCPRSRDPQETASPFLSPWPWSRRRAAATSAISRLPEGGPEKRKPAHRRSFCRRCLRRWHWPAATARARPAPERRPLL
ncbi:unnamed protein product [Ixodes pacificus]